MEQLYLVGAKVDALIARIARRYGLSHAALNALAVIEAAGGPLPAGEISTRMHITTATMTSLLDTLERGGYATRRRDPGDRRRVLIDITPEAQDLLNQVLPVVQQHTTVALSAFDDDALFDLVEALAAVGEAIDAAPGDLPPPPARRTPRRLRRA